MHGISGVREQLWEMRDGRKDEAAAKCRGLACDGNGRSALTTEHLRDDKNHDRAKEAAAKQHIKQGKADGRERRKKEKV